MSVVEQYAGRLNRNYAGKKDVIVFDYVDSHIPMFERMYGKRLKAYKQIGYEICCGLDREKQEANAIFDSENYKEVFKRDLLEAEQRIVISSNVISAKKVYEIINILKEKQALGIEVTIVTWEPDDYGFGDAAFWMQLHEDMRQAGFFIKTVEDSCENFAVIDQEIIWYGNIHLLGKEKVEDNIMRVKDKKLQLSYWNWRLNKYQIIWNLKISRKFALGDFLVRKNRNSYYSNIFPSTEMVTTCHGINFPLFCRAVFVAASNPPQQGTSIRAMVTL